MKNIVIISGFTMEINGCSVPLQVEADKGITIEIEVSLDHALAMIENKMAKLCKGYQIDIIQGECPLAQKLVISKVDYLDMHKNGWIKIIHKMMQSYHKKYQLGFVKINGHHTNIGGGDVS